MPTFKSAQEIKLIECPRDAMQGILDFIPTAEKVSYINSLLKVGFHTLDCGSFVSPKAIPQMRDTHEVLEALDLDHTETKLSVIVANLRGAEDAVLHKKVTYLGYPFSISETFQQRNTRKSIAESLNLVKDIYELTAKAHKELVVYISMGFGNPYGDAWNEGVVEKWVEELYAIGIRHFSLSDTVGVSVPKDIAAVFKLMQKQFKEAEFGAHFHTRLDNWEEKVDAAVKSGCLRFDGALKGYGGCPMAKDELVGNMPTEMLVQYFGREQLKLKKAPLKEALIKADELFSKYQ
jgi:hydroxymethylglutaryl-CoA lyase